MMRPKLLLTVRINVDGPHFYGEGVWTHKGEVWHIISAWEEPENGIAGRVMQVVGPERLL